MEAVVAEHDFTATIFTLTWIAAEHADCHHESLLGRGDEASATPGDRILDGVPNDILETPKAEMFW